MVRRTAGKKGFEEKVIEIRRVSKKTEGGNRYNFTALVVIGDRKGRVGMAMARAPDVRSAIGKAVKKANNHLIDIPFAGGTIPFAVDVKQGAARLMLWPASLGAGITVGGPARAVAELGGIKDISGKVLGSRNKLSNVRATFEALEKIKRLMEKYNNSS